MIAQTLFLNLHQTIRTSMKDISEFRDLSPEFRNEV